MNKEDKELLLKDLCARLPYGVICEIDLKPYKLKGINEHKKLWWFEFDGFRCLDGVKPYLRPMSSMTVEEKIKLYQVAGFYYLSNNELLKDEWRQFSDALSENELFLPYPMWGNNLQEVYNWLNAHHFDYRGLIEKDLAIAVSKDNNPYKE